METASGIVTLESVQLLNAEPFHNVSISKLLQYIPGVRLLMG
jgi:hypothetical protein